MQLCPYHAYVPHSKHSVRRDDRRVVAQLKREIRDDIQRIKTQILQECSQIQRGRYRLVRPDPYPDNGWEPIVLQEKIEVYKVCAAVGDRLVSVYDGKTEYRLGAQMYAPRGAASWPPLKACFYVFSTPQQAVQACFPREAKHPKTQAMHVLLRCTVGGRGYAHKVFDKFAVSELKVEQLITEPAERILAMAPDCFSSKLGRRTLAGAGGQETVITETRTTTTTKRKWG